MVIFALQYNLKVFRNEILTKPSCYCGIILKYKSYNLSLQYCKLTLGLISVTQMICVVYSAMPSCCCFYDDESNGLASVSYLIVINISNKPVFLHPSDC